MLLALGGVALASPSLPALPSASQPAALFNPPVSHAAGTVFPTAPHAVPGVQTTFDVSKINHYLRIGDTSRALTTARHVVANTARSREAAAAWMAIGMLEREAERHNLASEAFTQVRLQKGPLASMGAYYEAEQDLLRDRPAVAIRECESYLSQWPEGSQADACMRLISRGWAVQGKVELATETAEAYDEEHEDATISEQIELVLANWETTHSPQEAVVRLRKLVTDFTAPLTVRVADEMLAKHVALGTPGANIPLTTEELQTRALSLRTTKRLTEAWSAFEELVTRSADDARLAAWVDREATSFGWYTRNWDFLEEWYTTRYAKAPNADTARSLYRALSRGGSYEKASSWGRTGLTEYPTHSSWKSSQEEVARTMMLGGYYTEARDLLDSQRSRGGWTGRRVEYVAAFTAYMAEEHDDAKARFTAILDADRAYITESRYWRARANEALGDHDAAAVDQAWILKHDPGSWYGLHLGYPAGETHGPYPHTGTFTGPATAPFAPASPSTTPPMAHQVALTQTAPLRGRAAATGFASMTWPLRVPPSTPPPEIAAPDWATDSLQVPASYPTSRWFNPDEADIAVEKLADENRAAWPELQAAYDLARVGLYDLSGPMVSEMYEDWREAWRTSHHANHTAARKIRYESDDWRALFFFTRDHHHAARFMSGVEGYASTDEERVQARQLTYPLAHSRPVWEQGRTYDIDPMFVLALMRTESIYDANALSRVGARGAMQIMPSTGHLIAEITDDREFNAGDLNDPVLSIGYGVRYLGLLMDRYDHIYPLAAASYNGGPHNVSSWLRGTGSDMPMDLFVEHIPFRETRNYVRRVSQAYAGYIDRYSDEGAYLALPPHSLGNHPEIVDF